MYNRDYRDLWGGGLLFLVGCLSILHALQTLDLGTLQRMGPGMFPVGVGAILAVLGLLIMIPAFFRNGRRIHADISSFLIILTSIVVFALVVKPFGLVPAIISMILIASRAENRLSLGKAFVISLCLSAGAILIFAVGLSLPLNAVDWPW